MNITERDQEIFMEEIYRLFNEPALNTLSAKIGRAHV